MQISSITRLSDRGTLTLPKKARQLLGLSKSQTVRIVATANKLTIEPVDVVATSQLRSFSQKQIDGWVEEDQLTSNEKLDAIKKLENLSR